MEAILLAPLVASFFLVLFVMNFWIKKTHQIGLVWDDMNKLGEQKIAGSGGIVVVLGFILGTLTYIALKTFYFESTDNLIEILAALASILMVAGIGLIDDLFGWQRGGLSMKSRIVLVLLASVPLMVIN